MITDSILDVALERQLTPKWRGMGMQLTRNLILPVWIPDSQRYECGDTRLRVKQQMRNTEAMFIVHHSLGHYNGVIVLRQISQLILTWCDSMMALDLSKHMLSNITSFRGSRKHKHLNKIDTICRH